MKWQHVALVLSMILLVSGTITYTDLFGTLFNLTGVEYTHSGDITCGDTCESYINVTTSYWRICFADYDDTKYENETLFKKVSRSRTLHVNLANVDNVISTAPNVPVDWLVPTYGKKWRPIKDGDCWERGKVNKIKLVGHKANYETVKWGMFLDKYVDIDPVWGASATIEYTPSTRTVCEEGVCNKILYSRTSFIKEEDEWKNIKDAKSLKNSNIKPKIDFDEIHKVDVVAYNYTSITVEMNVSGLNLAQMQKYVIKYYDINGSFKKELQDSIQSFSREEDIITVTLDYSMSEILHFGENSTTIKLQDADSENMADSMLRYGSYADTNYGTSVYNFMQAVNRGMVYTMFNISSIPDGATIVNAAAYLYAYTSTTPEIYTINVHHVYTDWEEDVITYNNQPCGIDIDNATACNLTAESTILTDTGWLFWDVTNMLQTDYSASKGNFSFALTAPAVEYNQYTYFHSKEYTDDTTLRPYLNITYSEPIDKIWIRDATLNPTSQYIGENISVSGQINFTDGTPVANSSILILFNNTLTNTTSTPTWWDGPGMDSSLSLIYNNWSSGNIEGYGYYDLLSSKNFAFIVPNNESPGYASYIHDYLEADGHTVDYFDIDTTVAADIESYDMIMLYEVNSVVNDIIVNKPFLSIAGRGYVIDNLTLASAIDTNYAASTFYVSNYDHYITRIYGSSGDAAKNLGSFSYYASELSIFVHPDATTLGFYPSNDQTFVINENDTITGKPSAYIGYRRNYTPYAWELFDRAIYWLLEEEEILPILNYSNSGIQINTSITRPNETEVIDAAFSSQVLDLRIQELVNVSWNALEPEMDTLRYESTDPYGYNILGSLDIAVILDDLVIHDTYEQPLIDHLSSSNDVTLITDDNAINVDFSGFDLVVLHNDGGSGANFLVTDFLSNISGLPVLTTGPLSGNLDISTSYGQIRGLDNEIEILNNSLYPTQSRGVSVSNIKIFDFTIYSGYKLSLLPGAVTLVNQEDGAAYRFLNVNNYSTTQQNRTAHIGYVRDLDHINSYGWELVDRTIYWLMYEPQVYSSIDSDLTDYPNKTIEIRVSDSLFVWNATTPSWTKVTNGQTTGLPNGRYVQYRAKFNGNGTVVPILYNVTFNYTAFTTDSSGLYNYTFQVPPPVGNHKVIVHADSEGFNETNITNIEVLQYGTPQPTATKFNGSTTDWDYITNLSAVPISMILEIEAHGKIEFLEVINVSGKDLDANVFISYNNITVDSVTLPALNKSARLSLYNLLFIDPVILKDGNLCAYCNEISYSGGTLIFNVTSFSSYTVRENITLLIWDQNDKDLYGTGIVNLVNTSTNFFANFSYTNGTAVSDSDGDCSVKHRNHTDSWSEYSPMAYDSGNGLWNYTLSNGFGYSGDSYFFVNCTQDTLDINGTDTVFVSWSTSMDAFDEESDEEDVTQPLSNNNISINEISSFYANYTRDSTGEVITTLIWEFDGLINYPYALNLVDLDHDGDMEIVYGGNSAGDIYAVYLNGTEYPDYSYTPVTSYQYEISVGDFDNDSYDDDIAFFSSSGQYVVFINESSDLIAQSDPLGGTLYCIDVGDLDGDGYDDVVVGEAGDVHAVYSNGSLFWTSDLPVGSVYEVIIEDLDDDGSPEVLVYDSNAYVWVFNASGTYLWDSGDKGGVSPSIAVGDLDGDGNKDVLLTESYNQYAYDAYGTPIPDFYTGTSANVPAQSPDALITTDGHIILGGSSWLAYYLGNGTRLWRYPPALSGATRSIWYDDVNGDGEIEIIFSDTSSDIITILDIYGNLSWSYFIGGDAGQQYGTQPSIRTLDMNDDTINDVVVVVYKSGANLYAVQDVSCSISFNDSVSSDMTYDDSLNLWTYSRLFLDEGNYSYNTTCEKGGYEPQISEEYIFINPTPDFNLTFMSAPNIWDNETLVVNINISNDGTSNGTNINVSCYMDGSLFDSYLLNLSFGNFNYSNCTLDITDEGGNYYNISVSVDPLNLESEIYKDNNNLSVLTDINQTTALVVFDTDAFNITQPEYFENRTVLFNVNWTRNPDNISLADKGFLFPLWHDDPSGAVANSDIYSIFVANITDDEGYEIVTGGNRRLDMYDSLGNYLDYISTGGGPRYPHDMEVFDTNGDGRNEIIIGGSTNAYVKIYNSTLDLLWTSPISGVIYTLEVGDVTGDGDVNVVIGTNSGTDELRVYNSSLSLVWGYNVDNTITYNALVLHDVNNDSTLDIVVGCWDQKIRVINGSNEYIIWEDTVGSPIYSVNTFDLDGDGDYEILVGGTNYFYIYNSTGYQMHEIFTDTGSLDYNADFDVADLDNDGDLEIVVGNQYAHIVFIINSSYEIEDTSSLFGNVLSNVVIRDINNNYEKDIVATSYWGVNEFRILNRSLDAIYNYDFDFNNNIYPKDLFVADITGEGIDDVIIGGSDDAVWVFTSKQCLIYFNDTQEWKQIGPYGDKFQYNRTFLVGNYTYNVTCGRPYFQEQVYNGSIEIVPYVVMGTNFTIWDGSDWVDAIDSGEFIEFRCGVSSSDCEPDNQDVGSSQSIYRMCNNGTTAGSSVDMHINQTFSGYQMSWCYQESATVSDQSGTDGDCSQSYTGAYAVTDSGNWNNPSQVYDGNWGTLGFYNWFTDAYVYINYTKPSEATNASLWEIKIWEWDGFIRVNHSIENCFSQTPLQLRFTSNDNDAKGDAHCWNGASWEDIVVDEGVSSYIYEDAMWWYVNETVDVISFECDDDYTVAGATTLTTSNQTIHGTILQDTCVDISCWSDYGALIEGGFFDIYAYVIE